MPELYHETGWHGGTVFVEDAVPNLLFAKDGEVYGLGGLKTLVIGGAYSVDKFYRLSRGWSWFADEQPDDEAKARVVSNLDEVGWRVDCVLSHTCPHRVEPVADVVDGGRRVIMCHYPLMTWSGWESYMVHGHIHDDTRGAYWPLLASYGRALNAGVDVNGFQPCTLEELVENNCARKSAHDTFSRGRTLQDRFGEWDGKRYTGVGLDNDFESWGLPKPPHFMHFGA